MSDTDTIRKTLQETVGELVNVQVPPQYEHSISVVLNRSATENIKWRQLASEVVSKGEELKREGQIDVNRIRVGGRISGESQFEFQEEYEFTTSLSLLNRNQFKKVPRKKRKWISEPDSASYLLLTFGVFLCVIFYLSLAERLSEK